MIEPEMAFCDLDGDMDLAEDYIRFIYRDRWSTAPRIWRSSTSSSTSRAADPGEVVDQAFARVTYTEAVELLKASGQPFEFPVDWGADLQSEHERYLTEKHFQSPVMVYDYPQEIKPFYMRLNDDGRTVAAMDVLVPGIGEIIGGAQREERMDVLRQRMAACGLDPAAYWWYLDLRRYGTVPHAGFGLGFERTIQFATGIPNIRDVIPFPRTPNSADF